MATKDPSHPNIRNPLYLPSASRLLVPSHNIHFPIHPTHLYSNQFKHAPLLLFNIIAMRHSLPSTFAYDDDASLLNDTDTEDFSNDIDFPSQQVLRVKGVSSPCTLPSPPLDIDLPPRHRKTFTYESDASPLSDVDVQAPVLSPNPSGVKVKGGNGDKARSSMDFACVYAAWFMVRRCARKGVRGGMWNRVL
jgi:hypothetical protein